METPLNSPATDPLQGLIASQVLRIEVLRAQAQAFQALADAIAREGPKPTPVPGARADRDFIEAIPA
jgi:hypothetical protein